MVLSHTQTETYCHEQSLPSNFSPTHTHRQLITAVKPRRCAPSFCPSFTSVNKLNTAPSPSPCPSPPPETKKHHSLVLPKVVSPMSLSVCEYLFSPSMLPYFGAVRGCPCVCVCTHARLYPRQGHPSQRVPSVSNSLVYLSLDQRAAAACPQVSEQRALRTSWEEQEEEEEEGGQLLSSSGDKSFFTPTPNFHTFLSSHTIYLSL